VLDEDSGQTEVCCSVVQCVAVCYKHLMEIVVVVHVPLV